MTVISAWWRSNIPFQRLSGRLRERLNYYITRHRQEVRELEIRRVGDQTSWKQVVVGKATTQQKGPSGPRRSSGTGSVGDKMQWRKPAEWTPGPPVEHQEKDTTLMAIRVGVNILQSLFGLQFPLTRKRYTNKVRYIFFKEVFPCLYSLRQYVSCMYITAWICI